MRGEAGAVRLGDLEAVLKAEDIVALQEDVRHVHVDESLVDYALKIVERTRETEQLSLGVSPRGSLMLYHAAQAMAYLDGRGFCTPDDFKTLAIPVFAHRVVSITARPWPQALRAGGADSARYRSRHSCPRSERNRGRCIRGAAGILSPALIAPDTPSAIPL